MELREILPRLRDSLGFTAEEVSKSIGVSENIYKIYEQGNPEMPVRMLYRMAGCFGAGFDISLAVRGTRIRIVCQEGKDIEVEYEGGDADRADPPAEEDLKYEQEEKKQANGRKPSLSDVPETARKILDWQKSYSTGVGFFDKSHKNFIDVINSLHASTLEGWAYSRKPFEEAIRYMVRFFQTDMHNEETIMERIGYPEYKAHKQEHVSFLKEIHKQAERYKNGQEIDVRSFVVFLKEFVLSHIGISDRAFTLYLAQLKRNGALANIIIQVKTTGDNRVFIR
jgi:hemerythrin-like metal-binding protein